MEDKKFKEVLMKQAVEETSGNFTAEIMRRIEALPAAKSYYQPLVNPAIKLAFIIVFASVLSALIAVSIFIQPSDLPFKLTVTIPVIRIETFYNIVYFIIAFWLLMFFNYKAQHQNNVHLL